MQKIFARMNVEFELTDKQFEAFRKAVANTGDESDIEGVLKQSKLVVSGEGYIPLGSLTDNGFLPDFEFDKYEYDEIDFFVNMKEMREKGLEG